MAVGFPPHPCAGKLACLPGIRQCPPLLHGVLSPGGEPSSALCLWGGRPSPSLTPGLRHDLARRGYIGKLLFRTRSCPGCVALPLKCLPGKFGARPETAGDWASGHLILQPDAEVVPTASEAGVDLHGKLKGGKEGRSPSLMSVLCAADSQPHNAVVAEQPLYPAELWQSLMPAPCWDLVSLLVMEKRHLVWLRPEKRFVLNSAGAACRSQSPKLTASSQGFPAF